MQMRQKSKATLFVNILMAFIFILLIAGGVFIQQVITALPAHASDANTYPWPNAPCEFGTSGGVSCANPSGPSTDRYDWFNGNGGVFSGNGCGTKQPSSLCFDNFGYEYRNCTSYVAQKIHQVFGVTIPNNWGNANNWYIAAQPQYTLDDGNPQPGDIADWTGGSFGHVAYVAAVNNGVATYDEYNVARTGAFTNYYTSSNHPNGAPNHYIHIGSLNQTTNWSGNFVSTWGVNRLDAFTPGTNSSGSNTNHIWFNGSWKSWETLNFSQRITSWPAAVSWGSGRIDVFARGSAGQLLQAYYDGNGWHNWTSLGGCITGAPGVSSWGTNRLDIFAQGCNDNGVHLFHIWFDNTWHPWEALPITGGQLASAPTAVSWGRGRIDVFARNSSNGSLIQTYYDGNGWHNWTSLGGCITGAPGVSSWGVNRLDIFAQGCGDNGATTNHIWFNGTWQPWETLPYSQQITSSPSAVSWSANRIDVFARGAAGNLLHRFYDSNGWHAWESLGGSIGSL